jgi:HK97 family phage portal protein
MAETTFFGALEKAIAPRSRGTLAGIDARGGWYRILESFAGAWQRNVEIKVDSVLSYHADFACRTLIASDIAKLRVKLVQYSEADSIWTEVKNPAFSPVLRKPNAFQNRIQFYENWVLSKLQTGNTYVLKERNGRGMVRRLYVLDPRLVMPLVADNGDVFYQLQQDELAGLTTSVVVPATEIIHDRFNCFFHPLVGLSPIFANGLAAMQGLAIQNNATRFFQDGSTTPGILTAPGAIGDDTAKRLKEHWEANYTGKNAGKVAVLGDGLQYQSMSVKATDAQLIEQLKWTAEVVCSTYHVPPYKIGIGQMPSYNNVQALNTEYYSQCLQVLIEAIELCLDEGLATGETLGTEFEVDNLLRMDSVTQMDVIERGVKSGILSPDEGRRRLDLKPVTGGATPYLQQQNYSLAALAKRDAQDDPFGKAAPPAPEPAVPSANDNPPQERRISPVATVLRFAGSRKGG